MPDHRLSLSGAGIASANRPLIGAVVTLGKIPARVVRLAVEFTRLQHPDFLQENVIGT